MIGKRKGYVAPPRTSIAQEVHKLVPDVPLERLGKMDYNILYTVHSEIVCYGLNRDAVAELNIPGYRCGKDVTVAKNAVKQFRIDLKKKLRDEAKRKKEEARAKARAAKERARAARERARGRTQRWE